MGVDLKVTRESCSLSTSRDDCPWGLSSGSPEKAGTFSPLLARLQDVKFWGAQHVPYDTHSHCLERSYCKITAFPLTLGKQGLGWSGLQSLGRKIAFSRKKSLHTKENLLFMTVFGLSLQEF